jgi:hypothetical protein
VKKNFIFALSFCITVVIGYQFLKIPGSQVPRFHGEEFSGANELFIIGLIYCIAYFLVCIFFSIKYSHSQKVKYIIGIMCFFVVTSFIGFIINRYILF